MYGPQPPPPPQPQGGEGGAQHHPPQQPRGVRVAQPPPPLQPPPRRETYVSKTALATRVPEHTLNTIRAQSDAASYAAPLAANMVALAILRALAGVGPWPVLEIGPTRAQGTGLAGALFTDALLLDRQGNPARLDLRIQSTPIYDAYCRYVHLYGRPARPARLRGDNHVMGMLGRHFMAMFSLKHSSNYLHGLPPETQKNLRAELLRGACAALLGAPPPGCDAEAWYSMHNYILRHSKLMARTCKWAVFKVVLLGKENKPVPSSPAIRAAMQAPCVKAAVAEHIQQLTGPLVLDNTLPHQVRSPEATQNAQDKFAASKEGTWVRAGLGLNLDPRCTVRYRAWLGVQREAWIAELLAQEAAANRRLGEVEGGEGCVDGLAGLRGTVPEGRLEGGEDATDEEEAALAALAAEEGEGGGGEEGEGGGGEEGSEDVDEEEGEGGGGAGEGVGERISASGWRGKSWYPRRLAPPGADPKRRSVPLSTTALQHMGLLERGQIAVDIFYQDKRPVLRDGEKFGKSLVSNSVTVSVMIERPPRPKRAGTLQDAAPDGSGGRFAALDGKVLKGVDAGATNIAMVTSTAFHPLTGAPLEVTRTLTRKEWKSGCGDEQRLATALARSRRAGLCAPGGAWDLLRAAPRSTMRLADFERYLGAAHTAHPAMLAEKLKLWWARASFDRWMRNSSTLVGFYSGCFAGSLADGDKGMPTVVLYGDGGSGANVSTGPGRQSTPSTGAERACLTAAGAQRPKDGPTPMYLSSEFRSTALCGPWMEEPGCWERLHPVYAPTPERVYTAQAARQRRSEEAFGGGRPPPPLPPPMRKVRGKQLCLNPLCKVGFVTRDRHPGRALIANELSLARGEGGVPGMQRSTVVPKVRFPLGGFLLLAPQGGSSSGAL